MIVNRESGSKIVPQFWSIEAIKPRKERIISSFVWGLDSVNGFSPYRSLASEYIPSRFTMFRHRAYSNTPSPLG